MLPTEIEGIRLDNESLILLTERAAIPFENESLTELTDEGGE